MSVSKKLRFEVFKRDKFTCQYCGRRPPDVILECDHIQAKAKGGTDDMENLTTACFACNRGKRDGDLHDVAPAIDEMKVLENIQEMLERQIGLRRSVEVAKAKKEAEDEAIALINTWWEDDIGSPEVIQEPSLRRFLNELSMSEIQTAVDVTAGFSNKYDKPMWDTWKYFCGVCWTMIKRQGEGET